MPDSAAVKTYSLCFAAHTRSAPRHKFSKLYKRNYTGSSSQQRETKGKGNAQRASVARAPAQEEQPQPSERLRAQRAARASLPRRCKFISSSHHPSFLNLLFSYYCFSAESLKRFLTKGWIIDFLARE